MDLAEVHNPILAVVAWAAEARTRSRVRGSREAALEQVLPLGGQWVEKEVGLGGTWADRTADLTRPDGEGSLGLDPLWWVRRRAFSSSGRDQLEV